MKENIQYKWIKKWLVFEVIVQINSFHYKENGFNVL